jgi:signal transduction histidine kinase
MFNSLRTRLLLTLAAVVTVAIGTVSIFASHTTTAEFRRSVQGILDFPNYNIENRISAINKLLETKGGEQSIWDDLQGLMVGMGRTAEARFVMADLGGTVLADSTGELIGQQLNVQLSKPFAVFLIEGKPVLTYFAPLTDNSLETIEYRFVGSVNRSLLFAVAAAGLVAILLTTLLSRSMLRPIGALIAAARAMEKGDLSQRVNIQAGGEIGELAKAFNAMADGLDRLEKLRRNLVTDVAHELRTPLSNVRGYLEAIQDGVIRPTPEVIVSVYEETMLLNRLVDDLQELALAEAGQLRFLRQPVQIQDIVEKTVNLISPQAANKGVQVEINLPEDLPAIVADEERIGQVLRNLLNNALTNTPSGGVIRVAARTVDSLVEVSVQDTGVGIAAEHLPYVFERFYRVDKSRARVTGGAGLGLAIVKQLVEAQGGQVAITSQVGQGTTVSFTTPVARSPIGIEEPVAGFARIPGTDLVNNR